MLERAIEPYRNIKSLEAEKNRILANLNKIKAECDVMADDIKGNSQCLNQTKKKIINFFY